MSQSEPGKIAELASELAASFSDAIDENRLADIPDDSLGQLFASVVRAYAAKAQEGDPPRPFARNQGVTGTDVMIGCTAMLEGVGLQVFELGLWQAWSRLGSRRHLESETETEVTG